MGIYDIINGIIGPVMGPLKILGPFYVIFLVSLVVSLIVTLVYKWTTDQQLMKSLRDDIKRMQQELKKLKDNPSKSLKIQKEAMDKNMKLMTHSFKSTLITFIPLILIFGWLNMNFSYEPVQPGDNFSTYVFFDGSNLPKNITINVQEGVTLLSAAQAEIKTLGKDEKLPFNNQYLTSKNYGGFIAKGEEVYYAGWQLSGKEGEHLVDYYVDGKDIPYTQNILVSKTDYDKPLQKIEDGIVKGTMVDQGKLIVMNLFGWKLGWLGCYIIFSILFSTLMRKLLKVY
ncbi:hypothetical protein COV19_04270 [Candidatus Woesearchaeota archaeon CG10_big_fil_rev_8_21_14_0_10_44_13]|nr:MAG: hypothetical protein COV19_04270 [Candidatus Woesearchaeota archaeon CG10_big_fil_rev_8_21_14_0_10_44_13]